MDPNTPALALLDAAGGVKLPYAPDASDVVAPADARAVDLLEAPVLEVADLRAAAPGVHVRVEGCPRLRSLLLPPSGGAVVHVHRAATDAPLWIDGPIAAFDALLGGVGVSLPSGPTLTASPDGRTPEAPLQGAWLQHAARPAPQIPPTAELVVRFGRGALASLTGSGPRVLIAAGDPDGTVWDIPEGVARAAAVQTPRVGRVRGSGRLEVLEIDDAPRLSEVEAQGADLRLRNAGVAGDVLRIVGTWLRARVSAAPIVELRLDTAPRLDAPVEAPLVELHDCAALQRFEGPPVVAVTVTGRTAIQQADGRVEVRVRAEELRRALDAGANPTVLLRSMIVGRGIEVRTRRAPRDLADALQLLWALAERGADASECWSVRDALARRYAGGARWRWPFRDLDLADRAWLADIALWEIARATVPAAAAFDAALRGAATIHKVRLILLARAERVAAGRPHDVIDDVLFHVFRNGGLSSDRVLSPREVVHPLVATRNAPNGDALAAAACAWLARMVGDASALDALIALWRHDVPAAGVSLAEIATGPSGRARGWGHAERQHALRAVLAQPFAAAQSAALGP